MGYYLLEIQKTVLKFSSFSVFVLIYSFCFTQHFPLGSNITIIIKIIMHFICAKNQHKKEQRKTPSLAHVLKIDFEFTLSRNSTSSLFLLLKYKKRTHLTLTSTLYLCKFWIR